MAGLTDVNQGNKSSIHVTSLSLTDSAFCELEADSVASRNVTHLDQFGLLRVFGDSDSCHRYGIENLPKAVPCYDDLCLSSKSTNFQSMRESCDSDGCAESSNVEEMETSDTESLSRNGEWESSSSVTELSSSCCLSDESFMFSDPEIPCINDDAQLVIIIDADQLSTVNCCSNTHVSSPSDTSSGTVGNESQTAQHQPLVFFIIGIFVGLSLGFFTCKYVANTL